MFQVLLKISLQAPGSDVSALISTVSTGFVESYVKLAVLVGENRPFFPTSTASFL
jgi:hypothetical protein